MSEVGTPVVSVLTPAHNAADTIDACVLSVRAQDYADWEHVVVDDGSTDATAERLRWLATDPRLRVLHRPHARQAAARNAGLAIVRGDLVALLDADDRAVPERLAAQVAFLEAHPEVDVLGGAIINVGESGERQSFESLPTDHEELVSRIYRCCPFFASTVMARRRFFESLGGFDPAAPPAEDYDMWLRGYRSHRYHNLGIALASYRRRRIRLGNAWATSRAIVKSACREGRALRSAWYVARPLVALAAYRLGYRGGAR